MDLKAFRASLTEIAPPRELPPALSALWHDAKEDWKSAHNIVQEEDDRDSAWVHAYLHRREGDLDNAGYWYRRARKPISDESLSAEWESIVSALLTNLVSH
jgi:hypothetical protein